MAKFKLIKTWLPESYLVASTIFYWISTANLLNPFAIFLLGVLSALFVWKNRIFGETIAILFLILSLFMVLALASELKEFPSLNKDARIMLLVGGAWLGSNIVLAIMMLIKWRKWETMSHKLVAIPISS